MLAHLEHCCCCYCRKPEDAPAEQQQAQQAQQQPQPQQQQQQQDAATEELYDPEDALFESELPPRLQSRLTHR